MLDAYIIERIRREREGRPDARVPLRIERPATPEPPKARPEDEKGERGSVVIDYTL